MEASRLQIRVIRDNPRLGLIRTIRVLVWIRVIRVSRVWVNGSASSASSAFGFMDQRNPRLGLGSASSALDWGSAVIRVIRVWIWDPRSPRHPRFCSGPRLASQEEVAMLSYVAPRALRMVLLACALALVVVPSPVLRAQNGAAANAASAAGVPQLTPNYEAAAQWTSQKVSKLVFDTTVTPRWLEHSDKFWYSYQTREGRKFYFVDPVRKAKTPLFDHARMAAVLTSITRIPYDAQHLPFTNVKFVKDNTAFEFEVQVPADANIPSTKPKITTTEQSASRGGGDVQDDEWDMEGSPQQGQRGQGRGGAAGQQRGPRNKTLHFEYDMASGRVTLLEDYKEEPRPVRWASLSPDGKTILFARNHNLYMMDAENYARALKDPNDKTIVEVQLTTDGEDFYGYSSRSGGRGNQDDQQQQQQQQQQQRQGQSGKQHLNQQQHPRGQQPNGRPAQQQMPSGRQQTLQQQQQQGRGGPGGRPGQSKNDVITID
jgi:hypothetical protein